MELTIFYTKKNLDFGKRERLVRGFDPIDPTRLEESHVPLLTYYFPTAEVRNDNLILEGLFTAFNAEDNPLSNSIGQTIIKLQDASHTSMSVGDIVRFTDKGVSSYYACANIGWKKLPVNIDI